MSVRAALLAWRRTTNAEVTRCAQLVSPISLHSCDCRLFSVGARQRPPSRSLAAKGTVAQPAGERPFRLERFTARQLVDQLETKLFASSTADAPNSSEGNDRSGGAGSAGSSSTPAAPSSPASSSGSGDGASGSSDVPVPPAAVDAAADGRSNGEASAPTIVEDLVPSKQSQCLLLGIRRPLFPGFISYLDVANNQSLLATVAAAQKAGYKRVGLFLLKNAEEENQAWAASAAGAKDKDGRMPNMIAGANRSPGAVERRSPVEIVGGGSPFSPQGIELVTNIEDVHKIGVLATLQPYPDFRTNDKAAFIAYPVDRIRLVAIESVTSPSTPADAMTISPEGSADSMTKDAAADSSVIPVEPRVDAGTPAAFTNVTYSVARVSVLENEPYKSSNSLAQALITEIVNSFRELISTNPAFEQMLVYTYSAHVAAFRYADSAVHADLAAVLVSDFRVKTFRPAPVKELQEILESLVVEERLYKAMHLIKSEVVQARLAVQIAKQAEESLNKRQREYFLQEQLKTIQRELGMGKDTREITIEQLKEKANKSAMPANVRKVFDDELRKLQTLETASSEFHVIRTYVEWLTDLPWGKQTVDNLDPTNALRILDDDHHGLRDVKDRILEFIAVGKLTGKITGKILCLVGPPGVGKTSIGRSIAKSLGREFFRFSVGGLYDVAEIKGHRRTYVGALPGKMIQCLKKTKCENPLVLIDEIDKISQGRSYSGGDASAALLELLDPEQNSTFLDHYLDVPVDLSKVLFICTANMLDTIPGPLLDRMEVIQISGYVAEEKIAIAEKYLVPTARAGSGLGPAAAASDATAKPLPHAEISRNAIERLIQQYCRESGVRNLKKQIEKIYRKVALKVVKGDSDQFLIGPEHLKEYVGNPVYDSEIWFSDQAPSGVVLGLAYTANGGSTLYIESTLDAPINSDSKPSFNRTGKLGDVMKESSTIALTYAKAVLARRLPTNTFFRHASIHMHIPDGAVPKDGPSAGVTMTTSLLSLAMSKPVPTDIAMTGEITLTGRVLRVGGIREKVIAAKRAGVRRVLLPRHNEADWSDLPDYVREGLSATFVSDFDEIFDIVFPLSDGMELPLKFPLHPWMISTDAGKQHLSM